MTDLLSLYRTMVRIRAFEDAAEAASQGGVSAFGQSATAQPARVRGPLHLSTGQEAVAAVGAGQQVGGCQVRAHAGGHGLLAGGQVQRALDAHLAAAGGRAAPGHAALAGGFGRVLEGADAHHGAVQGKQISHSVDSK